MTDDPRCRLVRIIPAHAGFTGHRDQRHGDPTDHPRTRGVYPRPRPRPHHHEGIIPAHAGFTCVRLSLRARVADHPRTRGVYSRSRSHSCHILGSSPHTRGLPWAARALPPGTGIIPAHAGFTGRVTTAQPAGCGSSPHTRGLLAVRDLCHLVIRIIPAHAGFTGRRPRRTRWAGDHPRTRGVYTRARAPRHAGAGSSPHTRGLLRHEAGRGGVAGIIPAHAGFTQPARTASARARDHPRTRGVYPSAAVPRPPRVGSSPHTRGLLTTLGMIETTWGIIPAHAGFTSPTSTSAPSTGDHPRTRGVYAWRSLESQRSWSLPPPGFLHC